MNEHVKNTLQKSYPIPKSLKGTAHIDQKKYAALYEKSLGNNESFWLEQAQAFVAWQQAPKKASESDYTKGQVKWFADGILNVSENCIDKHLPEKADDVAFYFEPDQIDEDGQKITYQNLHDEVCKLANGLTSLGVGKGDRVCLYMPLIPQAIYAMLACARIGAVHSVVFGGFSADALRSRIDDAGAKVVITADAGRRGGKTIPLKNTTDKALSKEGHSVKQVIVVKATGQDISWHDGRDVDYADLVNEQPTTCKPQPMAATDPLFILYTSGSTGTPKGVLHGSGGYLVYAAMTHKYVFDMHKDDVYWCSADVGWITGHSYVVYGPLCNGSTSVIFEGVPTAPTPARCWQIIDKYKVSVFYTAPTAIRALHAQGDKWLADTQRTSLRVLGTVGEPINPEAWHWYYHEIGNGDCPIVDTWWQTETGGILITPLPGAVAAKPGAAMRPFFGVEPVILNDKGEELSGEAEGLLAIKRSWPGQMQTVYGDHERFYETYLSQFKGYYFSGDGAKRDKDGDIWITGRVDDVLNVSGHRLGTAEIESAIVLHDDIAEAAVVGVKHPIKGQGVYAFVTPNKGVEGDDDLAKELNALVREEIGAVAHLDAVQFTPDLPKTRSGKIMRRILRKIAAGDTDLGDISTLADESVVESLQQNRQRVGS